jgi:hypothetical protein
MEKIMSKTTTHNTERRDIDEQDRELTADELKDVAGGYGSEPPWCGTHSPGWHPGGPIGTRV